MPLDFTASNLTHTKPKGTFDFISPEASILPVGFGSGADFNFAGALTGQFLEANWNGEPYYKPPAHVVVTTWDTDLVIGAGIDNPPTSFGNPYVYREQFVYPVGFQNGTFGFGQAVQPDDYVRPSAFINASWQGSDAYLPAVSGLLGSWSDLIIISPVSIVYTGAFGDPTVYTDQIISPSGWESSVFGNHFVLDWFEYAAPQYVLNGSWVGSDVYTPPVDTLHVLWQPEYDDLVIAPTSFESSAMGSPRVGRVLYPTGIAPQSGVGSPQIFLSNCSTWMFDGPSNKVPLNFTNLHHDFEGNRVPIEFICVSSGIEYSEFDGFFDFGDGASASTQLFDLYLTFDAHEGALLEPLNLSTTHGLPLSFYEGGEWTGGQGCELVSGFTQVGLSDNTGTIGTHSFRLQNDGNGDTGSVIGLDPIVANETDNIEFSWTQSLTGAWFDNDQSDAFVAFGLFLDRNLENITTLSGFWEYNSPFWGYTEPNNWPWLQIWLPRDSGSKTITPLARNAAGANVPLTPFNKPLGVDLYAPGSLITVRLIKTVGKIRFELYHNGSLITGQNTNLDWPTQKIAPIWDYRNFSNPSSFVDIENVQVCISSVLTTYPATNFQFSPLFYEGASVDLSLATSTALNLNNFEEGASSTLDLETRPVVEFLVNAYEGAAGDINIATTSSMYPVGYEGAYVIADLTINPSADLSLTVGSDASVLFELSTAIQFGAVNGYEGATVTATLDTLENYIFGEGALLVAALSTSHTLPLDGYEGAQATLDLNTSPSEGMGVFRAYDGATTEYSFTVLPAIYLYPNEIKLNIGFNYDILGFGGIDLLQTSCCPVKDDNYGRIELTEGPAADERYDGDKTVFTVDLSTLQRFQMQMYEGATFNFVDPEYLQFNFFDGTAGHISSVIYDEYNFNLCTGNFIPDGDFINVELVAADVICDDATELAEGAYVTLELQANPNFQIPFPEGPYMAFDLTLQAAWIIDFYDGAYVRISNPEFEPKFYEGAEFSIQFEEKDIFGASGEYVQVSLTTDYDVEFLEVGCLDNEFVPMNENGDADFERFNPVPVELEFFSHSIKARCF